MISKFKQIIEEICKEKNIEYEYLSKDWIIKLKKNNKIKFISGYKFDLSNHSLGLILDDKYGTYEVLKSEEIPIIEHRVLYSSSNIKEYTKGCNTYEYLENLYNEFNNDIVLKMNNSTCGIGMYHITDKETLREVFNKYESSKASFSICPFYNIENEYRTIVLDKNIKLQYKKTRPIVTGDGKSTIKELLIKFNPNYFKDYNGSNKNDILEQGKIYEYGWQFNLSKGSISSININDNVKEKLNEIINKVIKKFDIGFGSIDIIKTVDNKYYIMEINSGVMMDNFIEQHEDGYNIAKGIYKEAIEKMLKE